MDLFNQAPLHLPHTIVGGLPIFTLPVTTSSAVIFSNLHNTFAPTLTNYPYSAFEPKPPPTSYLIFSLPMTTHTPPMTNAISPLAFPIRSWVTSSTPSYTVPTLFPSPTLPSSALPALFIDMTSAPGHHTPHSNNAIFLGSSPPKLLHKHDTGTVWTHSTSTTYTQLIYSLHPHFFKHQPSASPGPVQSLTSSPASPPSDDTQCQVCQILFDEEKMLLCDIFNAGWHMDCLLFPLTTIPAGIWKCPLCTPPAPSSQGPLQHLRFPSPILDTDSD